MGLRIVFAVFLVVLPGCIVKTAAIQNKSHTYWFECCDPGIDASHKDMCKWLHEKGKNTLIARDGTLLRAVWTDCKEGEELWRKWE